MPTTPLNVFICYAREDSEALRRLISHLAVFERKGTVKFWYDRSITGGKDWDAEIRFNLKNADIVLLLISPDFFQSDYIHSVELKEALQRDRNEEALVVPIILKRCLWHRHSELARLQALPSDAKPVYDRDHWPDPYDAFYDVAEHFDRILSNLETKARKARKNKREQAEQREEAFWKEIVKKAESSASLQERVALFRGYLDVPSFSLHRAEAEQIIQRTEMEIAIRQSVEAELQRVKRGWEDEAALRKEAEAELQRVKRGWEDEVALRKEAERRLRMLISLAAVAAGVLLVAFFIGRAFNGPNKEEETAQQYEEAWLRAQQANTLPALDSFLRQWPEGQYNRQAKLQRDSLKQEYDKIINDAELIIKADTLKYCDLLRKALALNPGDTEVLAWRQAAKCGSPQ